jgi:hypothetical protein
MSGNVFLLTLVVFVASCWMVTGRGKFLVPYRHARFENNGLAVELYGVVQLGNWLATMSVVDSRFSLKDTCQQLVYADQPLRIGSDDLAAEIRKRSEESA